MFHTISIKDNTAYITDGGIMTQMPYDDVIEKMFPKLFVKLYIEPVELNRDLFFSCEYFYLVDTTTRTAVLVASKTNRFINEHSLEEVTEAFGDWLKWKIVSYSDKYKDIRDFLDLVAEEGKFAKQPPRSAL